MTHIDAHNDSHSQRSRSPAIVTMAIGMGVILAACSQTIAPATPNADRVESTPSPSRPESTPNPTPDPARGIEARDAYIAAICPLFLDILALDPRLAALRAEGAAGGDVDAHAAEIDAVAAELRLVLNELDAVPDWAAGRRLRSELTLALHEMRAALLRVAQDPGRQDAAAQLAAVPYIARPTLDSSMAQAANAGLSCEGFG